MCGLVRAYKLRCCCTGRYDELTKEKDPEKVESCVGYFETEYSISSEKQMDGNGNTIIVTNLLVDPNRMIKADKIKEEWRQITHKPSVPEVKQAAELAWEGYLTSVECMNIGNMDITEIPRDQMDKLTSIVTKRVLLENITDNIDLGSILESVRAARLQMLNVELSEEDTRALVTAMRIHLEEVWLENVTLNIEELCQYEGLGKCKQLTVCGDTGKKDESCLKSWAAQKRWELTLDYDGMLMIEKAPAKIG